MIRKPTSVTRTEEIFPYTTLFRSVRSTDWSRQWPDPKLATVKEFPGVGLVALKFLHEERRILFHGHEPLDTDSTPTLERSEEHTSELQSLMRISYAICR